MLDKSNGRPVPASSPGALPESGATLAAHGLPSPTVDAEPPGSGQCTNTTSPSKLDTTEPPVASEGEDGAGTSDSFDTPHIEDDTSAVCFEPYYAGDQLAFLEAILTLEATSDVAPDTTGVEYREVVGTRYPLSFHPPSSHRPGPFFDVASVDPAIQPNDAESPAQ